MATTNPYALTSYEECWDKGYQDGLNGSGGLFGRPPGEYSPDEVDKYKEGFKAGKLDANSSVSVDPEAAQSSSSSSQDQQSAPTSDDQAWTFTVAGRTFEHVSTQGAQKALAQLAAGLERRIEYFEGYQEEFNKAADSHVMNFIIEAAGGGHWQPDAAIWATLKADVAKVTSAANSGQIIEAAKEVTSTSEEVEQAAEAWQSFLDHFQEGGNATIEGLGHVVKASIFVEVVLVNVATAGEAGVGTAALVGGGDSGLNELADQYVDVSTGKAKEMDFTKVVVDTLLGAVLGAAGGALEGKWAALLAKQAPGLVGAETPLMESIGSKFINTATGKVFTAAEMAAEMEPLWGRVITKLPLELIKKAIEGLVNAGFESKPSDETVADRILEQIDEATWEVIITEVLKELLTPA